MKILLVSQADSGGSGRATCRLHKGLEAIGLNPTMLVERKTTGYESIITTPTGIEKFGSKLKLQEHLDQLPLFIYPENKSLFSPQWFSGSILSKIKSKKPDIVNLHWINHGYLSIEAISKLNVPLILTLHDMWAFTGGCHYSESCSRYIQQCGNCPQLDSNRGHDLSRWVWQRKLRAWKNLNLTIVSPSQWLAQCAQSSSLFKDTQIKIIPNGLDTQTYQPLDRAIARSRLKLPQDKYLILFGAMSPTSDPRKGFHLLQSALKELASTSYRDHVELAIFGVSQPIKPFDFGLKTHYLGSFNDDVSLSLVYSAADVFVAPSVQDNLPNTVMEAIACGTPCVAFKVGGMPDMIEHSKNGYLANPFDISDFVKGILWLLEDKDRLKKIGEACRVKAEDEFSNQKQAHNYVKLFSEILN